MSLTSALIRLYPAAWRERYGEEFAVLLEERPVGPFDVADIILGALDARLRLRDAGTATAQGEGFVMPIRIGGTAAVLGGVLWLLGTVFGFVAKRDPLGPSLLFLGGWLAILVALAGLSAFQARNRPELMWFAFIVPAIGGVVGIGGIVSMHLGLNGVGVTNWSLWSLTAIPGLGFMIFAIATFRSGTLSRPAAAILAVGSAMPLLAISLSSAEWTAVVGSGIVAAGWIALGLQATRIDRPATLRTV